MYKFKSPYELSQLCFLLLILYRFLFNVSYFSFPNFPHLLIGLLCFSFIFPPILSSPFQLSFTRFLFLIYSPLFIISFIKFPYYSFTIVLSLHFLLRFFSLSSLAYVFSITPLKYTSFPFIDYLTFFLPFLPSFSSFYLFLFFCSLLSFLSIHFLFSHLFHLLSPTSFTIPSYSYINIIERSKPIQ